MVIHWKGFTWAIGITFCFDILILYEVTIHFQSFHNINTMCQYWPIRRNQKISIGAVEGRTTIYICSLAVSKSIVTRSERRKEWRSESHRANSASPSSLWVSHSATSVNPTCSSPHRPVCDPNRIGCVPRTSDFVSLAGVGVLFPTRGVMKQRGANTRWTVAIADLNGWILWLTEPKKRAYHECI